MNVDDDAARRRSILGSGSVGDAGKLKFLVVRQKANIHAGEQANQLAARVGEGVRSSESALVAGSKWHPNREICFGVDGCGDDVFVVADLVAGGELGHCACGMEDDRAWRGAAPTPKSLPRVEISHALTDVAWDPLCGPASFR